MSPKAKDELAADHLLVAREALDNERPGDALNALFYGSEAAIVALADANGIGTKKNHHLKASAAAELHQKGVLKTDFGPLLRQLNQGRKDYWYEGDDPHIDLENAYDEVSHLVTAAQEDK